MLGCVEFFVHPRIIPSPPSVATLRSVRGAGVQGTSSSLATPAPTPANFEGGWGRVWEGQRVLSFYYKGARSGRPGVACCALTPGGVVQSLRDAPAPAPAEGAFSDFGCQPPLPAVLEPEAGLGIGRWKVDSLGRSVGLPLCRLHGDIGGGLGFGKRSVVGGDGDFRRDDRLFISLA